MVEALAPADPASPWMICLERAHALALTAARRIEEESEPRAHLGPAARKIEGGLAAMYDAFDGRADRTTSIGVAHARLFEAAILAARAGLTGALEALGAACGELIAAEERFPRVPIAGRASIALQAGVDLPPFHTLDRASLTPSLRAPPEPEVLEPEIAVPELPEPKTFAELSAAAAAMKQIAKDRAEARKKRKATPKKIAPPPEEVPRGFAHAPPRAMAEDEFVRRWARECIDEVGMLGVQRTPLLGDDWRSSHPLEKRLVAAIDAIAALGPRAVAHVEPYALDAPAADPMRIFAVTMIGGCLEGRDAIACAERVLHHFGPGDPAVAEPFMSAMKLAENPFAPNVLRSLLASGDRACRRIGAEVLAHRGIATERELVDWTEDGDPELFAIALPAIAASRSREVHRAIATGSRTPIRASSAPRSTRWRSRRTPMRVSRRAAAAGPLGDAALLRLAIVADDQEARWLLERLHAQPTEAAIEAAGWAGLVDAVPALLRLLESGEDDQKLAAGEALYRLLGAQILEMVEIAPDDLDPADVTDPDPEARPPRVSLADLVSDPRDRPPQGQPEKIEVPSFDPDRWRAYWNEQGSRIDAKLRIRRGQGYAPSISLYELDRLPLTPRERRALHRELCARTGKITPFDPHDFVAAQEARLKVWEGARAIDAVGAGHVGAAFGCVDAKGDPDGTRAGIIAAAMSGASSSDRNVGEIAADLGHVTTVDAAVPTPVAQAESAASFAVLPGADGDTHARGPLKPGDSLGRFVLRAELGRGGMGVVYAADDAKLGREVALKVLPISDDDDSRRRFFREARAAAGLTDPGIATIYDVGEDAGRVFIAMELVRGKTLRALLDARPLKDRALPIAEALRVGREVARALAAAHARRVTHRDLKPENVMITDAGHVKILDFGLAKRADPSLETGSIGTASTDAGRILGTPSYMSPEQAKGRPVDVRSDVFSLGVMLYELTTGARPFDRPTIVEMFVAIDRDEPAPPSRATPLLPASFERVVLRCLRKDPALRYADAREVLADLEPLTTTPQSPRFSRAAIAAAIAVAFAGVVALAATRAPTTQVAITPIDRAKVTPAIVPVPLTALPLPEQGKPEAIAAYRDAIRAYRDGDDWDNGFERALELDPTLTVAHVRLAGLAMAMAMPSSREHFRKADEQRGALSDRDRGLLDAIEPVVRRQPSDWAEGNKRLAALTDRFPGDAELWFLLASGTANYADFEAGVRYYEKAAALDPAFARAYAGVAMDEAYLGHFDAARGAITRCLAASPVSHACLSNLLLFQAIAGECEDLEATARRTIAAGAPKWNAYTQLALALAGRGQPISTVREALRQAEASIDPAKTKIRERAAVGNALRLGLLAGDFEAAEKNARAYEKLVAESREQDEHGLVALGLSEILGEQGRDKDAAEVAIDFLDRRDAWEPNPGAEDVAMSRDATPSLLVAALVGGRLTRADYVTRRAASLKSWTTRVTPVSRNFVWLHAWARPAFDAESAREAVAALPSFLRRRRFGLETAVDHDVGRAFLLAGRTDDAIAWLEPYTKSCTVFDNPIEHTRSFLLLGRAREAKGDTSGACAAYKVVLDRWGKAKPKSVTADAAQARVKALRCGG